jgi:hypothetical protein
MPCWRSCLSDGVDTVRPASHLARGAQFHCLRLVNQQQTDSKNPPFAGRRTAIRRFLLMCQMLLVLGSVARAGGNVRILNIGLNRLCPTDQPCPILVALSNPAPRPQDFELQIGVSRTGESGGPDPERTYIHRLTLGPLEERQIDAMIQPSYENEAVEVAARNPQGSPTGHDLQDFKSDWMPHWAVGVLCEEESVCKSVQSQIQLSGSPVDRDWKNKNLPLVVPLRPRSAWWSYGLFSAVVVAAPVDHLNSTQRSALEWYVRSGGSLILLGGAIGDTHFLVEYRRDPTGRSGVPIGTGLLYRVQSGRLLEEMFGGESLYKLFGSREAYLTTPGPGSLQMKYATTFIFPHLGMLLVWLSVYILVVGWVNFALLRRWRRLEWGWLTVAGVAMLFVFLLYEFGSLHRLRHVTVDSVAVHYLDAQSGQATSDYGVRISVPERQKVVLHTASDTLLVKDSRYRDGFSHSLPSAWEGRRFTRGSYEDTPLDHDPLPDGEIALSMPRWTSQDLYFKGIHSFPGTVREISFGHLRNDTGQRFFDAVFLDSGQNRLWLFGEVAPGAEIDLAQAHYVMPWPPAYKANPDRPMPPDLAVNGSFLAKLVWGRLPAPEPRGPIDRRFYGLSAGPAQPVQLLASRKIQREYALLVVIFQ